MPIKKTAGILCCLLGLVNISYAIGLPRVPKIKIPKLKSPHLETGFNRISTANVQWGLAHLQPLTLSGKLPQTVPSFISPVSVQRVVGRVSESGLPGYEINFPESLRGFKKSSGLSLFQEVSEVLRSYGPQGQFYGSFETSLSDVFHSSDALSYPWTTAADALADAWHAGMSKKTGFLTIRVKIPFREDIADILLVDIANRQLISLEKSILETQRLLWQGDGVPANPSFSFDFVRMLEQGGGGLRTRSEEYAGQGGPSITEELEARGFSGSR